ncbi:hypothetical protein [Granulicella sibirica]|uniref:Uncharacterized protein n=1 Tax=Granulicella sibirica TaxID=2479048 RepID=A0A4Q0T089_9BACT|nr:hypothetical protein [Granulicella sibirica]RXH54786.1 hypothetical protein GRAN_3890 [Granulicella sibirica]
MQPETGHNETGVIQLPSPTAWPMVLALGLSLILAGMVTHIVIAILGLLLTVAGSVGWFLQVLPHEAHEGSLVHTEEVEVVSSRTLIERLPTDEMHRKILPITTFQISTGIKGGIAGGIAMTVPAGIFSVLRYHSFWYATNLLAAGGFVSWASASNAFLGQFHLQGAIAALIIHGLTSLLVGLLYGAMLPMFPRYPILTAGLVAPLLFTGILYSALGIVSPILNQRIDWFYFVLSQIAFGLVCGWVVNLHEKVRTPQFRALPFAIRAGLHTDLGTPKPEPSVREDESR